MRYVVGIVFSLLVWSPVTIAQEFIDTDIIWQSDEEIRSLVATKCGEILFTARSKVDARNTLYRYNQEADTAERVYIPLLGDSLRISNVAYNPVHGEVVLGYYGGILLSHDCGKTWQYPPTIAPPNVPVVMRFDRNGALYVGSWGGEAASYWTADYTTWHPMHCRFYLRTFDVSDEGTIITIEDSRDVYRFTKPDSCEVVAHYPNFNMNSVYSPKPKTWILADWWSSFFMSVDDGRTWERKGLYGAYFDDFVKVSDFYSIALGDYSVTDRSSLFVSNDLFETAAVYSIDVDGYADILAIDAEGYVWMAFSLYAGKEYQVHRTKMSFKPIVYTPDLQIQLDTLIHLNQHRIELANAHTTCEVVVSDVVGRQLISTVLSPDKPSVDITPFTGALVVQAREESSPSRQVIKVMR